MVIANQMHNRKTESILVKRERSSNLRTRPELAESAGRVPQQLLRAEFEAGELAQGGHAGFFSV